MSTTVCNLDNFLTLAEAATLMRISRGTLQRLLRTENAPPVCKIAPRSLRIQESALRDWLHARNV